MKPKNKEISSKPAPTYHLGRTCENLECREPIADHERKSKRHCAEYVTLEILEAYGIATNNYITISHGFQESTLEFLGFDIIMNPIKKTIKLQKNDKPTGMDDGRKIS
jgi:hypothetical protein